MLPKHPKKRRRKIDANMMPKWPQNGPQKPPKNGPKIYLKNAPKSTPMLKRLLSDAQGLILDVQDPILELKLMIFGPPEAHFRHFFWKNIARCTPQRAQGFPQDCWPIVSQNATSQKEGRRWHAAWRHRQFYKHPTHYILLLSAFLVRDRPPPP